jgi:hypothetical protein
MTGAIEAKNFLASSLYEVFSLLTMSGVFNQPVAGEGSASHIFNKGK